MIAILSRCIVLLQVLGTTALGLDAGASVIVQSATAPKPCCAPDQWEGIVYQQDASYDRIQDRAAYNNTINHLAFDYHAKKIAVDTKVLAGDSTVKQSYRMVTDFNQKAVWVIQGTSCSKQSAYTDIISPCINDGAEFLGSHMYGGVAGRTWVSEAGNVTSRITVSEVDCYPLTASFLTTGNVWDLRLLNFQNVTEGIKDTGMFTLPKNCPK